MSLWNPKGYQISYAIDSNSMIALGLRFEKHVAQSFLKIDLSQQFIIAIIRDNDRQQ